MGVFVHICSMGEAPNGPHEPPAFSGALIARRFEPTTEQLLRCMSGPESGSVVSRLADYPRWAEPGLALFARLLHRASGDVLTQCAAGRWQVVYGRGPSPERAIATEVISAIPCSSGVQVRFRSKFYQLGCWMPAGPSDESLRGMVSRACAAVFRWHDGIPPLPPSLAALPVRTRYDGGLAVELCDVPGYVYPHLIEALRFDLAASDLPAALWWSFLQDPSRVLSTS